MLDNLRNFATTLPGKILGAFLLIGLAGFGVSGLLTSVGGNTVAKVGDKDITALDFQRAYQTELNNTAQQIGQVPTAEMALQLGIPSTVLSRLATDKVLTAMGSEFGLGVSDERIAEALRDDPSFGGTLGGFDRGAFEQTLQRSGYTESEFFQSRRDAARRQQLAMALFSKVNPPETVNHLIRRFSEDQRVMNYMVLSAANLLPVAEPTEEELAEYLATNQSDYRTDELRNVDVMVLTPEILAAGYEISDENIAAEYERTKQNYVNIERRTISQLPLPDDATVALFEQGIENGESFDALLEETGLTPTSLGTLTQAGINDSALADAAFGLDVGEYALIPGVLGQRAVYVSAIEPGGQMTLEEASDQVEQRLRTARAREDYINVLDHVEEQRAAFIALDEIASGAGLDVETIDVAAGGAALEGFGGLTSADASEVAQNIFSGSEGELTPSVALGANKTVWFDLNGIEEARDQTMDEVHDALFTDVMAERQDVALGQKATQLVSALAAGEPFDNVAVDNNLMPQISAPFGRGGDGSDTITSTVASAAFQGGVGHIGSARDVNGQFVVFEVTSIQTSDEPLSDADADFVANSFRNNLYSDFAGGLRDDAELRVNQNVLRQVLGLDAN